MLNLKPYTGPDREVFERLFLNWVNKLAAGQVNHATARAAMRDALIAVDYQPPTEDDEDTLNDFTSEERLDLVIGTNVYLRQGYRNWIDGQDEEILDHWPAQELYQAHRTEEPDDWQARWQAAGGQFFDGRMIALKNTALWSALSSFGLPYPPFAPGSGFDVRDVQRNEAIKLGLPLDRKQRILPQNLPALKKLFLF